jgi:hypothetical protein
VEQFCQVFTYTSAGRSNKLQVLFTLAINRFFEPGIAGGLHAHVAVLPHPAEQPRPNQHDQYRDRSDDQRL